MTRKKTEINGPVYYTTFQVARLLGVSPPAVVNWVNSGLLPAHRTPGGHRRISRDDLSKFVRERNYPVPPGLEAPRKTLSRRRILVVDDERDFSESVRDYLVLHGGFEVEIADSGFSAGLTIARFEPHVILMDIMMPDMDGFAVLRMLRADPVTRSIPVVACTAYRDADIEARIREEAFAGMLLKPLDLADLVRYLEGICAASG